MSSPISCEEYGYCGAKTPWVVWGYENMDNSNTIFTTPQANSMGIVGESSLPYTVPTGKVLYFDFFTIEPLYGVQCWPYIWTATTTSVTQFNALDTFQACGSGVFGGVPTTGSTGNGASFNSVNTTQQFEAGLWIPAGLTLNLGMRPVAGGPAGTLSYEFSMHGFLCNVTC